MRKSGLAVLAALILQACGSRSDLIEPVPRGAKPPNGGEDGGQGNDANTRLDAAPCGETMCAGSCVDLPTDPKNCGACGHDCLGGACLASRCQPVQLASGHPFAFLAANATSLFAGWPGGIESIALPTGTPVSVVNAHVGGIAANDPDLFWVSDDGLWVARGGVASGARSLVSEMEPLGQYATGIALDASNVYWVGHTGTAGTLRAAGLDGTQPRALPAPNAFIPSLAADGQAVYWIINGAVGKTILPMGPATQLAPGNSAFLGDIFANALLAIDDLNVFAATTPEITSVPKAGGAAQSVAPNWNAMAIAIDTTYVYWAEIPDEHSGSNIMRAPKAGGPVEMLASSQPVTQRVLVDAVSVVWANSGVGASDGNVMRLAK
jgi:hypothetical protein